MAQPNTDTCGVYTKRASEQRTYTFEFAAHPEIVAGQTMSSPAVSANLIENGQPTGTSDLTLGSPSVSGTTVVFTISGGTTGDAHRITCTVSLSGGGNLKEFGDLRIRN